MPGCVLLLVSTPNTGAPKSVKANTLNNAFPGAAKYLLTALPTDYFLLFQEVVTENKNGFARSMKI